MITEKLKILPRILALLVLAVGTTACSRDMSDLERYITEVNTRPGGRIEPLPVIRPYQSFAYEAYELRSPFLPETPLGPASTPDRGIRPDRGRSREFLEQFPLDTLAMVGTLTFEGAYYALVQTPDTLVHRVQIGNFVGQNDGRIISIDEQEIQVNEIVADGIGGYIERDATIGLDDA